MAKTQTRRGVSLNRNDYEAAKQEAARRNMSLSGFVEFSPASIGVAIVNHPQQTPELVCANAAARTKSMLGFR